MTRRPANRKPKPPPKLSQAIIIEAGAAGLMPLAYMLGVMNDLTADPARRDRMAIAAAQYCHQRAADTRRGKKDIEDEAASNAGEGTVWSDDLQYSDGHPRQ